MKFTVLRAWEWANVPSTFPASFLSLLVSCCSSVNEHFCSTCGHVSKHSLMAVVSLVNVMPVSKWVQGIHYLWPAAFNCLFEPCMQSKCCCLPHGVPWCYCNMYGGTKVVCCHLLWKQLVSLCCVHVTWCSIVFYTSQREWLWDHSAKDSVGIRRRKNKS
jgi:hypothetical protein